MYVTSAVKGVFWGERSKGQNRNEAVDSQHGTGVGGSLHPHAKGYYPKEEVFFITTYELNIVVCALKMLVCC